MHELCMLSCAPNKSRRAELSRHISSNKLLCYIFGNENEIQFCFCFSGTHCNFSAVCLYLTQKQDPTQFLRIHARASKIHLDPAVAAAAESPVTM